MIQVLHKTSKKVGFHGTLMEVRGRVWARARVGVNVRVWVRVG